MIKTVIKRDGSEVSFNLEKITKAVQKAFVSQEVESEEVYATISNDVLNRLEVEGKEVVELEHIQDLVRRMIDKNGYSEVGKAFSKYRRHKDKQRKSRENIYKSIKNICKLTDRENANVGNGPSSKLLQIAEVASRDFAELTLVDDNILEAMKDNKIYPHDFSWLSVGTTTCNFIPFRKLLSKGFNPGHGYIRVPKRIRTAGQLFCIIFQSSQNDQHGGQASGWFERDLAPYVTAEYNHQYKLIIDTLETICSARILKKLGLKKVLGKLAMTNLVKSKIEKLAWERTDEETFQTCESIVANLNTMHSRAGAQVPFTSINIGTGISKEERLLIKNILLAYEKGLGKGEQPLFPNIVFKVKDGVNYEPGTPNHDMLRLAMRVTAKRLFPTYNFQDCSLNKGFPGDVPSMGCRTAVRWDRHLSEDEQTCEGRGNLSFTTLDLPGMALECKYGKDQVVEGLEFLFAKLAKKYGIKVPSAYADLDLVKRFFLMENQYADLAVEQLVARFKYQSTFTVSDFPFLMNGSWIESENLGKLDKLGEVLKHGTLGIGFIGLAETLICLVGKHHAEDKDAFKLGKEIVKFLAEKAKEASDLHDLNFSVIATPAEGLTGKLVARDREIYGVVAGVTDKEWYTNSSHVPVEYEISLFEKIRIEGEFVKYCSGGSITYVELNESPGENIDAIYAIVQAMHDGDVVVGAINFPCDRCLDCGHFGLIEGDTCPVCGGKHISRIRRITGYLAEIENFNYAKYQEAMNRVKHDTRTA